MDDLEDRDGFDEIAKIIDRQTPDEEFVGAVAGRCVIHGKTVATEEINAYAAVALAGLGWLPDTILSRSVIIRMRRRHHGEQVEQFRRRIHLAEGERIRTMIESWALLAEFEIVAPENMPTNIQDRDADVWESLITVADAVGGEWPARTRAAAIALVAESKERDPSLGVRLLADLKEIFGDAQEMTTEAILRELHALNESPWNDLKGKPLNDRGLAQRLRQYEIKPKVLGGGSHRGYRREDLHDAWDRYLAPPPSSDGSVTSVTSQPFQQPSYINVTDVTDVTLVAAKGGDPDPDGWSFNTEDDDLSIPECLRRA